MLEVLAALMISFAFLMGTLNALAITALMQVKAERQAQATYWIQQDLENIRSRASNSSDTAFSTCTGSPNSCCATTFAASYAGKLQTALGATYTTSKNIVGNKSYTLSRISAGSNTNPQILQLTYSVYETGDTNRTLATLYTELIPPAALSCS